MSTLIIALSPAPFITEGDYFVVDQGSPPVSRLATRSQIRAAAVNSVGQVGPRNKIRGPVKISQLEKASVVYLNDTMIVDQGVPAITRKATILQILSYTLETVPQNSEVSTSGTNLTINGLPNAATVYGPDSIVVNQALNTITRRAKARDIPIQPDFVGVPVFGTTPLSVQFTDLTIQPTSAWLWDFGDSVTSTLENPPHTYPLSGVYTVSLTVTFPSGVVRNITKVAYITVIDADPLWASVLLLMPGDTVTTDYSLLKNVMAISNGNVVTNSVRPLFGQPTLYTGPTPPSSGLFSPYGSVYLATFGQGGQGGFQLDSRDFTVEWWQYVEPVVGSYIQPIATVCNGLYPMLAGELAASGIWSWWIGYGSVGNPGAWAAKIDTSTPVVRSAWQFIQLIRSGSTFTLAIDGVSRGTATYSGTIDPPMPNTGTNSFVTNQGFATPFYVSQHRVTRAARAIGVPTKPWPRRGP